MAYCLVFVAPKDDEGYEYALTILQLEHELEEILKYVSIITLLPSVLTPFSGFCFAGEKLR